jgi:DNA-binding response OmpR family regulator
VRILLVEDDRKLAQFVARGLRVERFAVDVAGDGLEGEGFLNAYAYDLAVLDLMLPKLDGTELLRRARQLHPFMPVLILTARDEVEQKVRNLQAGADDYLTKPFDFTELVARIRALLRRVPAERVDVLRVADLELNRITQQVRRSQQRIELTAKEYALLEYLLCSPGRVFSRSMILNHVWDQSFEGVTNIVDVYVRYLRKKIDEPFNPKLIHTVRGFGYCVREPDADDNPANGSPANGSPANGE